MAKKQKYPHLVNSKWTSRTKTWGWRHFRVANRKNQKSLVFAEMVAACDETIRFWVNARALKDRQLWLPGWQSLQPESNAQSLTQESPSAPPEWHRSITARTEPPMN